MLKLLVDADDVEVRVLVGEDLRTPASSTPVRRVGARDVRCFEGRSLRPVFPFDGLVITPLADRDDDSTVLAPLGLPLLWAANRHQRRFLRGVGGVSVDG